LVDGRDVEVTHEAEKLGLNSSQTVDLVLDGVRVDRDRLLHEEGNGFRVAMTTLDGGRIGIAAQAVGIAQAGYEVAREYAKERRGVGGRHRGVPGGPGESAPTSAGDDGAGLPPHPAGLGTGAGKPPPEGGGAG